MHQPFKAVQVTDAVYWVGAIDPNVREFHGYLTSRGTTYNSYLVLGEKTALIDTVKAQFKDEMMARIASVVEPSKVDYIISSHAEMDHSGCLPDAVAEMKPEKVFASKMGVAALAAHFHGGLDVTPVEDGGELALGPDLTLKFMETRFLHWPDSMFCYLPQRNFLFSQDAFGMHLAGTERFADQVPPWLIKHESSKYYANIVLPFSNIVQKLLEKLDASGLVINMVAPAHGPIWRSGFRDVLGWYRLWSKQTLKQSVLVLYDTMWGSTDLMARTICDGLSSTGVAVKQICLSQSHRSDVATELLDAGALVVGSPTLNNQVYPTIADAMSYIKGLKPRPRPSATFGSFGWSGESTKQIEEALTAMDFENLGQVKAKYVPDHKLLQECWELGRLVGERVCPQDPDGVTRF